MCSIIGYLNFENGDAETLKSLELLKHRGKDIYSIYSNSNNKIITTKNLKELKERISKFNKDKNNNKNNSKIVFGHNLFPLVNHIEQPLKKKGIFITNCEIYNWKELNLKYSLNARNDAEVIFLLIEKLGVEKIKTILKELDGTYALAYYNDNQLILTRDILGIKPLFISLNLKKNSIAFASEKKALNQNGIIGEVDPKQILIYNLKTKKLKLIRKEFFKLEKELENSYKQIEEKTTNLLLKAIKKRIPKNKKLGVLFSGGLDSTFIALILKELNIPFTCYTAKIEGGNIEEAEDLIFAKRIAKKYNFNLKIISIKTNKLEKYTKEVIKIIEDDDFIKVSVALPFYLSSIKAKEDNIEVLFSGLGSEEIFAGYNRHKKTKTINKECLNGLEILFYRDLYRDDTITMSQTIELRLPFLDRELIEYSLKIPAKYKLDKKTNRNKIILRNIAKKLGLENEFAERPKKAAQYGSKFDKGLLRLAKDNNLQKQEYLHSLKTKK